MAHHRKAAGIRFVALTCGLTAGLSIVLGDLLFSPWTHDALSRLVPVRDERLQALLLGVLYGGITEEILVRWGLMSLIAWILVRLRVSRTVAFRTRLIPGEAAIEQTLNKTLSYMPPLAA